MDLLLWYTSSGQVVDPRERVRDWLAYARTTTAIWNQRTVPGALPGPRLGRHDGAGHMRLVGHGEEAAKFTKSTFAVKEDPAQGSTGEKRALEDDERVDVVRPNKQHLE
ncbi:unnamed protein product [Discula destructiva]